MFDVPVAGEMATKMIFLPSGDQRAAWHPTPLGSEKLAPQSSPLMWISGRPVPLAWTTQIEPSTPGVTWRGKERSFPCGDRTGPLLGFRVPGRHCRSWHRSADLAHTATLV